MTASSATGRPSRRLSALVPALIFAFGFAALVLFASYHTAASLSRMEAAELRSVRLLGLNVSATLESSLRRKDPSEARRAIERMSNARNLEFAVYLGPGGRVLHSTRHALRGLTCDDPPLLEFRDEVAAVRGGLRGQVQLDAARTRIVGVFPVFVDTLGEGMVGAVVHLHDVGLLRSSLLRESVLWTAIGAACLFALCWLLWRFLRRVLLVRLDRVRQFAGDLARGAQPERIAVEGADEIAELARHMESTARALQERSRMLEESQRMEAIGRLAGGVAHDFNNLLMVITGTCSLVRRRLVTLGEPAGSDQINKLVEEIELAGSRAAALTTRLLSFSHQEVVKPTDLSPAQVVSEMGGMLRRLTGVDQQLRFDLRTDRLVRFDKGQLEQIILNLIVNARDATPKGGVIEVVVADSTADGAHVDLVVRDSGTGIEPEVVERIFEPFFTTKPAGQGTGLGLATVRSNVREAGGRVEVASEVGVGTTFTVSIPALEARHAGPIEAVSPSVGMHHLRVLFCEDDEAVRSVTTRQLQSADAIVWSFSRAEPALRWLELGEEIDVLVTDVLMPEIDGIECARRAREIRPDLRIVFISGYAARASLDDLAGFSDAAFVRKPFSIFELIEAIEGTDLATS